jgi:hypothetical protein
MRFVQLLHRRFVSGEPGEMVSLVGVAPQCESRVDVHLLPMLRTRRKRGRAVGGGEAVPLLLDADRLAHERIAPRRHRDTPVRHGAARVRARDGGERLVRLVEPERMEHRHRAVELLLDAWRARRGEGDGAQLLSRFAVIVLCGERRRGDSDSKRSQKQAAH